jgi:hypothetical protein
MLVIRTGQHTMRRSEAMSGQMQTDRRANTPESIEGGVPGCDWLNLQDSGNAINLPPYLVERRKSLQEGVHAKPAIHRIQKAAINFTSENPPGVNGVEIGIPQHDRGGGGDRRQSAAETDVASRGFVGYLADIPEEPAIAGGHEGKGHGVQHPAWDNGKCAGQRASRFFHG